MTINNPKDCPARKVARIISKKWTMQIMRDMIFGKKHFQEFLENNKGLTDQVLLTRLKDMEKIGLINKKTLKSKPYLTEYFLTENGKKLNIIFSELGNY